jgi:ABC-type antimicrobial peptide transport system permease subunit
LRNVGIVLLLAFGVSLAPTVMTWSSTGIKIEITQFVEDTIYQIGVQPALWSEASGFDGYYEAEQYYLQHQWVKRVDRVLSTACYVDGHLWPDRMYNLNEQLLYAQGLQDARLILVTNETLEVWKPQFQWNGSPQLGPNEVAVSNMFVHYYEEIFDREIGINSSLNLDLILGAHGIYPNIEGNRRYRMMNLTIVAVYRSIKFPSVLADSFPSLERLLFDPFLPPVPVMDLPDSVMLRIDRLPDDVLNEVQTRSFFAPSSLIQVNAPDLLAASESAVEENMLSILEHVQQIEGTISWGVQETETLQNRIDIFIQSRILILLGLPSLLIALLIAVNTTETSVTGRGKELSLLRTKGASFNQVLSSYMWESIVLSVLGLVLGLGISLFLASFLGASTGVFSVNFELFQQYLAELNVVPLSLVIAGFIAMTLPITYLVHIAKLIDVHEVGQPIETTTDEVEVTSSRWRTPFLLFILVVLLELMPFLFPPIGLLSVAEVTLATGALYLTVVLGARVMRQVFSTIADRITFVTGEKSIYISRSLKKRKGKFLPLLMILALILTSTTMMIMQLNGFQTNLAREMEYSIGADVRIQGDETPFNFSETIYQLPGVLHVAPVLEVEANIGDQYFFLEGVNALDYAKVGRFQSNSFSEEADIALQRMNDVDSGIILSWFLGRLWNKTVGDLINVTYTQASGYTGIGVFNITGFMQSAPGFGSASTVDVSANTLSHSFGFQVARGGFALVNLEYLQYLTEYEFAKFFLIDLFEAADVESTLTLIDSRVDTAIFSPYTAKVEELSLEARLFLQGLTGLISVELVVSLGMALFAILTLLGSTVQERAGEYAILRAVGATQRQIISLVFDEFSGIVIAATVLSFVLGTALGFVMSILTFGISPILSVLLPSLIIPVQLLIVILGFETLVLILACYIPARKVTKTDPATVLRNL